MVQTRAMTTDEFAQFMRAEVEKWAPVARRLGDAK
jgi:hypothetical protein